MRRLSVLAVFAALVLLVAGCGGPAPQPLRFNPAPWQDGEISVYRVADAGGRELGTAQWVWTQDPDGWTQAYELRLASRTDRGEVIISGDLAMRRSWREVGSNRYEARYAADGITITMTLAGASTSRYLRSVADAIDNDVSLQIHRALPLAQGFATRYTNVIPTTATALSTSLRVVAEEEVTVPAGVFRAWRVELSAGGRTHDAWYGQQAPYPLVKYRNRASGAVFELQSLSVGATGLGELPSPAPGTAAVPSAELPPVNVSLLVVILLVQMPLMILFPLVLGWWIRRRFGIGWGVFGIGAATFIASQVVHLPLNFALGLLGGGRGVALWPLVPLALVAGLSAGVCEEGARWIVLRFFARTTRGWRAGLQFGAGHGAAEAIILGLLVLVNVVALLALRQVGSTLLGMAGVPADQLAEAQAAFWNTPVYMSALAGLERVMAIAFHIAAATLVMRSVTRGRPGYLLAAIGLHTLMNAWAVWASQSIGVGVTYVGLASFAVFCLWLIWRLREAPAPAEPEPAPGPGSIPTAADLAPRALSPEEIARRAEASRYE